MSTPPLPPGTTGLPYLGEALKIAADPFAWVAGRAQEHGPVVRSKLLGQDLALLSGPAAAVAFLDEDNVTRAGGLPPHAADLFGAGAVNQLDGAAHRVRKAHLMRALDRDALAAYLPGMRASLRARMARWHAAGEVPLQTEAARASVAWLVGCLAGIEADDATLDRYGAGYADFGKALVGLPLALPGTPLRRARAFTAEMRARYAGIAEARRTAPTGDGLSRLVASEVAGERMSTDEIAKECHHLVFAGSGLWAWMCHGARALAEDPALAARLRAAVADLPPEPTGRQLGEVPGLDAFVREVERTALVIPFTSFGVAKRDFVVDGHTVPAGWLVTWGTTSSHTVARVSGYAAPERFDPARFDRGEGAGLHAFAPQGPGEAHTSHRCGGVELSTLALQLFFAELLRGPAFTLAPQDLALDRASMPARYPGGLRIRFA